MRKAWVLDTETKGTGAHVVPLEQAEAKPEPTRRKRARPEPSQPRPPRKPRPEPEITAGPLPPGHVRKKTTGELGKVQSVDPKAGTATVLWLRQGRSSTVRLSEISRR